VVAQIYGVGLITTRLSGLEFEIGIFVGLGGILVCSFLGGMRAVTWTQVAQYIILIIAYMIPVVWLSVKQTGVPIPQAVYGYQLQKVTEREKQLIDDPKEQEVIADLQEARPTLSTPSSRTCPRRWRRQGRRQKKVADLKAANAPRWPTSRRRPRRRWRPAQDEAAAKEAWTAPRRRPSAPSRWRHAAHAQAQFAGDPNGDDKAAARLRRSAATSWPWCSA
jgi:cation/acetate symporter